MRIPFILTLLAAAAIPLRAQLDQLETEYVRKQVDSMRSDDSGKTSGKPDPKRIINETKSLLKEREPEMTAEEYALYEKVTLLLSSQPEFAIKLLEAMTTDKASPSPAFEFMLGNAYYSANKNDKAEVHFRNAVKKYPTFVRAWDNLGVLYYSKDNFSEAIGCFSQAVALGDHEPTTFGLLGYSLERSDNAVGAEMAYMQALAGDPRNGDWLEGLLRVYVDSRQYGRAESLVKSLIKIRPGEARFWQTYAGILVAENKPLDATIILESAAGSGFAGPAELSLLGELYAAQGLQEEAATTFGKVLAVSPDLGERKLINLAQVLTQQGKLSAADDVLRRLPDSPADSARVSFLFARSELQMARHQWPQARLGVQEILRREPLNGNALLTLGRVYLAENDPAQAMLAFESALPISGSTYTASLELANLELRSRHYDKTVTYLEKALAIERTDAVLDFLTRVRALAAK
ncbi:MAG TPA: tetratricopeptide repeat protein [Candidatus Didemnitutus sp.]|nr:tetratricopeptide repeat protein [Candidatus Didemnitutus sp.]